MLLSATLSTLSNNHIPMTMNRAIPFFARPAYSSSLQLVLNLFAVIISFTFGNTPSSSFFVEAFSAHHHLFTSSSSHRPRQHAVFTSGHSRDAIMVPIRYHSVSLKSSSFAGELLPSKTNNTEGGEHKSAAVEVAMRAETTPRLTAEDKAFVSFLFNNNNNNNSNENSDSSDVVADESRDQILLSPLEVAITDCLQDMSPGLLVALQMAAKTGEWKQGENEEDSATTINDNDDAMMHFETQMVQVGRALQNVLDARLRSGRELLAELLNSGEIRKLDSLIGKAAREGRLDMSFFSVLSMNMQDAAMENNNKKNNDFNDGNGGVAVTTSSTTSQDDNQSNNQVTPIKTDGNNNNNNNNSANRAQILQHIYTRCQEELEKNVPPGMGLLNKLLRTEISSIRTNQLQYYLGPQVTSITSPDGKTIELNNNNINGTGGKALVSHGEFIDALSQTVSQIRTLEKSGGTDRLSAMNLIENIRRVAMEARVVLVDSYGEESEIVSEFQRDLQPVFRPSGGGKVESATSSSQ